MTRAPTAAPPGWRVARALEYGTSVGLLVLGGLVLVGWAFDLVILTSILPGLVRMKPNTALAFLLTGLLLWLALGAPAAPQGRRGGRLVAGLLAVTVGLIGGLTLLEYGFGWDLGIDQLLFRDAVRRVDPPYHGRMAPVTALAFLLTSGALVGLLSTRAAVAQGLALVVGLVGLVNFIGYTYGVPEIPGVLAYTQMAIHTTLGFLLVSLGILAAIPHQGVVGLLTSPTVGGVLVRRLLPAALGLPFLGGWLLLRGQQTGLFNEEFGVALLVVTMMLAFAGLIAATARALRRLDRQRQDAEAAQRHNEQMLTGIIASASDAIITSTADQHIVVFNAAAERMFGCPAAAAIGQPLERFIPARFHADHAGYIERFATTGATNRAMGAQETLVAQRADGTEFPIEATIARVVAADQQLYTVIIRDITARQAAEAATRENEQRLFQILEAVPLGISVFDSDQRPYYVNQAGQQILGQGNAPDATLAEVAATYQAYQAGTDQLYPTEALPIVRAFAGETSTVEDMVIHRPDRVVPLQVWGAPIHDAAGRVVYAIVAYTDITERKQAEADQRLLHERFARAFRATPDALSLSRVDNGVIVEINERWPTVFGYTREEVIGHNAFELNLLANPAGRQAVVAAVQAHGFLHDHEMIIRQKSGVLRDVLLSVELLEIAGEPHLLSIVRDLTAYKQAEAARLAGEAAAQANQAKSEFLGRMSHELRTPLNAILGFGELLELEALAPRQHESVHHILKAGRHLLALINEVLDITRIEAGRLAISPEPVLLRDVLQESLDLIHPTAAHRQIPVTTGDLAAAPYVLADQQRLKQVLLNLLANAVKYNRRGGSVYVTWEERPGPVLRVSVHDTGRGIPPDLVDRLFTPFDRLGAEATGEEGTGLGLALSQRLMEAMGGRIGVESTVGQGSTFWIELPLVDAPVAPADPPAEVEAPPAAAAGPARTVLLIDDNLANLRLVERILEIRPGITILSALQGRLGLELARQHRPDLVLLDLQLPDLDGEEVLRRLQGDPATEAIPVIIFSADATPGQIARLRRAGAHDYLTKPFRVAAFLALIDGVLHENGVTAG